MKTHKFDNGFKGPMPALLAAMRVLKKNLSLYKRMSKKSCHLQILRDAIENEIGTKSPGFDKFVRSLLLQTFSQMTAPEQGFFPASFFAVAKSENVFTSTEGFLAKLGYVQLIPSLNKVKYVCTQKFEKDDDGKPTSVSYQVKEGLTHDQEFHSAVKILLPMISKRDDVSIEEQLKRPEIYLSDQSREFYKKHADLVDSFNKTYAYSSAYAKKSSKKTKLVHVMNEVGKVSRLVDRKLDYVDANGKTVKSYMELRLTYRRAMEKLLNRPKSPSKRNAEESGNLKAVQSGTSSSKKARKMSTGTGANEPPKTANIHNRFAELDEYDSLFDETTPMET